MLPTTFYGNQEQPLNKCPKIKEGLIASVPGMFQVCFKIGFSFCCRRWILQKSGQSVEMFPKPFRKNRRSCLFLNWFLDVFQTNKNEQPKKQKTHDMGDLPPWRQGMQSWQIKVYFGIPEPKDVLIVVVDKPASWERVDPTAPRGFV